MKKLSVLLSYFMAILFSTNLIAQPGWNWQNPLPQGNPLYKVSINSSCGWAVGPYGTAIHTRDYGETWEKVDLGTNRNLNAVCMHDDLMAFIVGDNGLILFVLDHIDSIEVIQQTSNTTVNLKSVTSDINGCPWIAGEDGTVLRSTDMGQTWVKQNVIYQYNLNCLHNIECTEAWAVGPDGFMMYTHDWGITWSYVPTPTNLYLFSVDVGTFENIRVTGQQGLILHTSDKGITWETEHQENGYNLHDVINIGLNNAYAVGTDQKILETIDYGATWTEPGTTPDLYNTTLYDVEDHYGLNQVWVTGHYGTLLKNSGIETPFVLQTKGTLQWLYEVQFFGEQGWAVGGIYNTDISKGIILHTTDGGSTWEEQYSISTLLDDIDFINENEGWAVGRNGMIKHTINGGNYWGTQDCPVSGLLTSVCFVDEDNGWAVSRDNWGEIIHTTNGGSDWELQTNPSANPLHDVFFIDANKGWAVGLDTTIIRTIDGGQNWLRVAPYTVTGARYASVFFINEMIGWAVGTNGTIVLTKNGGVNWQQVESGTFEMLESVYFLDEENGWAVGDKGTILRSVDGGYHWIKQASGVATNFLASVFFTDLENGWIAGEGGTIIRTTNGGFSHEPGSFLVYNLNLPIYDNAETESSILVDVSEVIREEYVMTGLEVFIDSILHSRVSDLEITLSHNDIECTLVNHVSDDGENFLWTTLKDDAITPVSDGIAPFSGDYKPVQALSVFNGSNPNGTWTLHIYDSETGHEGSLNAWGIRPIFEKAVFIQEDKKLTHEKFISLLQNSPNPFSTETSIKWHSEVGGLHTLKIYDAFGKEIMTLFSENKVPGDYEVLFDCNELSSGIYFYTLRCGEYFDTKKMVIIR